MPQDSQTDTRRNSHFCHQRQFYLSRRLASLLFRSKSKPSIMVPCEPLAQLKVRPHSQWELFKGCRWKHDRRRIQHVNARVDILPPLSLFRSRSVNPAFGPRHNRLQSVLSLRLRWQSDCYQSCGGSRVFSPVEHSLSVARVTTGELQGLQFKRGPLW